MPFGEGTKQITLIFQLINPDHEKYIFFDSA